MILLNIKLNYVNRFIATLVKTHKLPGRIITKTCDKCALHQS